MLRCSSTVLVLLLSAFSLQAADKPLTNDDVIAMVQAGLPEGVIIEKIRVSPGQFDTSVEGLVALKKAGVSERIVRVIVNPELSSADVRAGAMAVVPGVPSAAPAPCQAAAGQGSMPWLTGASPAMWYEYPESGDRLEMVYERGTVNRIWFGVGQVHLLELNPLRAGLRTGSQPVFYSCMNPNDAPLVKFTLDKGSDERNTSVGRGGPWNYKQKISEEDLVRFASAKTPEGYFKITVDQPLSPGEYGFVPQGQAGFFLFGERVYTFGVD
jgi:hypothetical protein